MKANQVTAALEREKELLEQILELAECQPELMESDRADDLEILLSLRGGALSELNEAEEAIEAEMGDCQNPATTTEELRDINQLNLAILGLVDRIVNLDEQVELFAELSEDCAVASRHAESEASCSD
jgi:hypothetical protein